MKKTLKMTAIVLSVLSFPALTGLAHAANPGAYAGLGLGASILETPKQQLFQQNNNPHSAASYSRGGLGGRVFGGYNYNQYLGVEAGYSRYANSKYKGISASKLPNGSTKNSSINYSMSAFDLVGKGYLPIGESNFNVYGLAGAAYVKSTTQYKNGKVALDSKVTAPADGSKTNSKVRPIIGAGASYNIPQTSVVTNVEYSHIQGSGNVRTSPSAIPSADLLTLNVAYNFG